MCVVFGKFEGERSVSTKITITYGNH